MDTYVYIMCCLSTFGFFIIFFSLYLLITVPTKLTPFTRFVMHGHDLLAAIAQLYITLAIQPRIVLPCASGFTSGLASYFEVMTTLNQAWTSIAAIAISASFSLLLTVNRALAVSLGLSKKIKTSILAAYLIQLGAQIVFVASAGLSIEDGGKETRKSCIKMLSYDYPQEMDSFKGLNIELSKSLGSKLIIAYMIGCTAFYTIVGFTCGTLLVRSISSQAKSSQSSLFLANQRKITIGIVSFLVMEKIGVGVPIICLAVCGIFSIGTMAVSHYVVISVCVYPVFGPYYVLMSNTDYRNRVNKMLRTVRRISNRERTIISTTF